MKIRLLTLITTMSLPPKVFGDFQTQYRKSKNSQREIGHIPDSTVLSKIKFKLSHLIVYTSIYGFVIIVQHCRLLLFVIQIFFSNLY